VGPLLLAGAGGRPLASWVAPPLQLPGPLRERVPGRSGSGIRTDRVASSEPPWPPRPVLGAAQGQPEAPPGMALDLEGMIDDGDDLDLLDEISDEETGLPSLGRRPGGAGEDSVWDTFIEIFVNVSDNSTERYRMRVSERLMDIDTVAAVVLQTRWLGAA
jgi:hypothetical protein